MADLAGVNASPLIVLLRAGYFELLRIAGTRVTVPRAVTDEINRRGRGDPAVDAVSAATWLEVVDTPPVASEIAVRNLGAGESALLA